VFTFSNIAALIHYSATFGVTFLLSLFLQYGKNLDPASAGAILMVQSGVMAIVSPAAGRLSERIAPRFLSSAGMALITAGLLLLTSTGSGTPVRTIVAILALLGLGFAVFSSPNTNAVMSAVARKWYGLAGSSLATMRLTGQTLSMGIVLLVFAGRIGRDSIPPGGNEPFFSGVRTVFAVFAVLSVVGVFASLVRGELPQMGEGET
ncbi:MAG: MFS transporter, partial [Bacteroidota bacterium]|nr:MFS transporter [Bacteroidota bacterium]